MDRYGIGMNVLKDNETIKQYGFDHVFQVLDDGENLHNTDEYTRFLADKGKLDEFRRVYKQNAPACNPHPFSPDETADGFIGRKGIEFIEQYRGTEPFYLNLSFIGPHPPYWHPGELQHDPEMMPPPKGAVNDSEIREKRAHYMDKCSLIDQYIGKLIEILKRRNMYENTIVIFTSDHGDCLGDFNIWDKRYFYEMSVGVPLFMSGPGIPKGERLNGPRISRALVSHLDLFPTILDLAGCKDEHSKEKIGLNLLTLLYDPGSVTRRNVFSSLGTAIMIRDGMWKLVFDPQQGGSGIYLI